MQSELDIVIHSVDLSGRGLTPSGKPVFRVVFAPTRIDKVLNKETGEIVQMRRYSEEGWVLEKWTDAETYAGAREAWETVNLAANVSMEYPADGEYEAVYSFSPGEDVTHADFIAKVMNFDRENFTFAERRLALKLKKEMDAKEVDRQRDEIIDRAFHSAPILDATGRAYSH